MLLERDELVPLERNEIHTVRMTVPGRSVVPWERNEIISLTLKIISACQYSHK